MDLLRCLLLLISVKCGWSYSLWCYTCDLKDQCFKLNPRDYQQQTQCDPGTTHCIMERTVSAVTGAIVENRMCGGQVYVDKNQPLADGCYVITRQEASRINTTRCYCSTSYCNAATAVAAPSRHLLVALGTGLVIVVARLFGEVR